jgi:hypothetical protein
LASREKVDFYLIDEKQILLPKYNGENNFVALYEVIQESVTGSHRALRLELLLAAIPLKQFYAAMKGAPLKVEWGRWRAEKRSSLLN